MNFNKEDYYELPVGVVLKEGDLYVGSHGWGLSSPTSSIGYIVEMGDVGYFWRKRTCISPAPKALTNDNGKPPLAALPWKALREVSMVQLYGKDKYGDYWNYKKGMEVMRNASCAIRHIADYIDGQDNDHESGRKAIAHAACRLLFILENELDGVAIDDRYKKQ